MTARQPLTFPQLVQHPKGDNGRRFELTAYYAYYGGPKGRNVRHRYFALFASGKLVVFPGYMWDLGTGAIDDPSMIAASLEHDAYCQMVREGLLPERFRPEIDKLFRERLQEYSRTRLGRWWAWARWSAVVLARKIKGAG